MKKWLTIITCLLICTLLTAQENTKERHHEIGINATRLFNQFTGFSNIGSGLYLINYKYIKNKNAFRFGTNIVNVNLPSESIGFSQNRRFSTNNRIGYQRNIPIYNKWQTYVGGDLLIRYTKLGLQRSLLNSFSFGAGPVMGIQFLLNKRIRFFTESTFYFIYRKRIDSDIKQYSASLNIPFHLFLAVKL